MANAKANIYPVQLQGAELNLNKFDAEIKQYSGFNKNNSPFVGGCLSTPYSISYTFFYIPRNNRDICHTKQKSHKFLYHSNRYIAYIFHKHIMVLL